MRTRNWIVRFALILMIVVSLFFSWLIWTHPGRTEQGNASNETTTTQNTSEATYRIGDIYLPTQAIQNDGSQSSIIYRDKESIIALLKKEIQTWDFSNYKIENVSEETYKTYYNRKNSLQLVYPTEISLALFGTTFSQKTVSKDKNVHFNRIVLDLDDRDTVYLLSDTTRNVIRFNVKHTNLSKIKKIISTETKHIVVENGWLNDAPFTSVVEEQELPQLSYLINKQKASDYVQNLFEDSTSVNSKEEDADTVLYYDGRYDRMWYNEKTSAIRFESYQSSLNKVPEGFTETLEEGFNQLDTLTPANNNFIRFFDYKASDKILTYRSYVGIYPIFSSLGFGGLSIQFQETGGKVYRFLGDTLQIPLPTSSQKIKIPNSDAVLAQIEAAGFDSKKVSKLEIAYRWDPSSESELVVNLTPAWYVRYNKEWRSVSDLLANKSVTESTSTAGGNDGL